MATLKIKYSKITDTPVSLVEGELAFSRSSNKMFIGVDSGSGVLQVGADISDSSITQLNDVLTTMTPIDGQVLTYDTTNGWQSETHAAGVTDHLLLSNIGTNTHAVIDTHLANSALHFTEASIAITKLQVSDFSDGDYATAAQGILADSALQDLSTQSITTLLDVLTTMAPNDGDVLTFDTTNGWQSEPAPEGVTDHTLLTNIGTNTHQQIDTHIDDATIHFTEASISITESQISNLQSYLLDITAESIKDLSDVLTTMTPNSGEVLTYDATNGWQAEPSAGEESYSEQLADYLSETQLYRGEAKNVGALTSAPVWRIRHILVGINGDSATTTYADGVQTFTKVWDDRATYTYS